MAIYNEILSPRFANLIKKIFSLKGGQGTRQVSGELIPVLPFLVGAEVRFLENWNRFGFSAAQAAAAGFLSQFRFRNPKNNNIVAVLEKITAIAGPPGPSAVQDTVRVGFGAFTTDYANLIATQTRLDARGAQNASLIVSSQATVGTFTDNLISVVQSPAGQGIDVILTDIQEIPLLPGDALDISLFTVNVQLQVSAIWRERLLEESERQ